MDGGRPNCTGDQGTGYGKFSRKLPLMWKLLTGITAEELYDHLERRDLFPKE